MVVLVVAVVTVSGCWFFPPLLFAASPAMRDSFTVRAQRLALAIPQIFVSRHGNRPASQSFQMLAIKACRYKPAMLITMEPVDHADSKRSAQFRTPQREMTIIVLPQMTVTNENEEVRAVPEIEVHAKPTAPVQPAAIHKYCPVRQWRPTQISIGMAPEHPSRRIVVTRYPNPTVTLSPSPAAIMKRYGTPGII